MLSKKKILQYMDFKIAEAKKENDYDNALDDNCIGKEKFIASSYRALNVLKEARAFINSGLAED